jgi:hypothetical protein
MWQDLLNFVNRGSGPKEVRYQIKWLFIPSLSLIAAALHAFLSD